MARPPQPIAPTEPLLIVDQRTPFVAHCAPMRDVHDAPLVGRIATLSLVSQERDDIAPIHNTLSGIGVNVGDGVYSLVLMPRALWLRLAPFAHQRIYLRASIAGEASTFIPLRVVWRAANYPVTD